MSVTKKYCQLDLWMSDRAAKNAPVQKRKRRQRSSAPALFGDSIERQTEIVFENASHESPVMDAPLLKYG